MVPVSQPLCNIAPVALMSVLAAVPGFAQTAPKSPLPALAIQHAIVLVESGRCADAVPALKRGLPMVADRQLKYRAGMALVRCSMALDQEQTVVDTLLMIEREYPGDAEVLYIATHYFSEMGMKASRELQVRAPNSFQARKLEAESLESQGKDEDAAVIYNKILEDNPKTPGIHYRLGQIDLAKAGASGSTAEAKQEFVRETEVDPLNAAAHFVLGELARRSNDWDEAVRYFSRAAKLDVGFSEAYLALGMSLTASGKYSEAVSPLRNYVKMQPDDPAGHYQLALAYSRTGDKEGAAREMDLQVKAAASAQRPADTLEGHSIHP
jgi:tetratricopeptide (TPR) repeat protein